MNRGKGPDPNIIMRFGEARRIVRECRVNLGLAQDHLAAAHQLIAKEAKGKEHDNARQMIRAAQNLLLVAYEVTDPALDLVGLAEKWL